MCLCNPLSTALSMYVCVYDHVSIYNLSAFISYHFLSIPECMCDCFIGARMKEKLMAVAQEQALADFNQIKGDVVEATFGQQIRNYVFAPYKMVKDTRTGYETSQVT